MMLSERVLESTAEVREQANVYAARAADFARAGADRAADQVAMAYGPVDQLTEASLKFSQLSHQCVTRLLRRQGAMVKGALHEGEKRLHRLARASTLQQAVAGQVEDLNEIPARVGRNLRETWDIVAEAGRDVTALAAATYAGLVAPPPAPKRARAATPRRRPAAGARKTPARRRAAP